MLFRARRARARGFTRVWCAQKVCKPAVGATRRQPILARGLLFRARRPRARGFTRVWGAQKVCKPAVGATRKQPTLARVFLLRARRARARNVDDRVSAFGRRLVGGVARPRVCVLCAIGRVLSSTLGRGVGAARKRLARWRERSHVRAMILLWGRTYARICAMCIRPSANLCVAFGYRVPFLPALITIARVAWHSLLTTLEYILTFLRWSHCAVLALLSIESHVVHITLGVGV